MRSSSITISFLLASAFSIFSAKAAIHYVDVNSTNPVPPYANWDTAAMTIQDAVDNSVSGDQVIVTNGIYDQGGRAISGLLTNRVAVSTRITIRSVNGPEVTIIQGYQVPGTTNGNSAIRCAFLVNGAILVGFTLTNGATQMSTSSDGWGGGVLCAPGNATVSNCVIVGNAASANGGGAAGGILNQCSLLQNSAGSAGGAAYQCTLNNCRLANNATSFNGGGGGALRSVLNGCLIVSNSAGTGGGTYQSTVANCVLIGNRAASLPTGTARGGGACQGTLNNCLLIGNFAYYGGGADAAFLTNCTVVSNSATFGGGLNLAPIPAGGGIAFPPANTIVFYNEAISNSPNCFAPSGGKIQRNCCTTPDFAGATDITNPPSFVDPADGDFHLAPNSPCINAGRNAYITNTTDLDGNPRIMGDTVDIGAYEFQNALSVISYSWLQNHGLPTDGSADYADSDGDGMNNWQEWVTNTDPTNSLSYLHMLAPDGTNNVGGVTIHWQSAGMNYFLQRSTNLAGPFTTFATNFFAGVGIATYRDATATNAGPYFYRVGVQP